ncbi:MAG: cupin domain-containing protein [Alphaproteobacteria bacterium]
MEFTVHSFADDGDIPNHPRYPLIAYRGVLDATTADRATSFENLFWQNRWQWTWRNGIYSFHHYHSNAHEVLGIAAGGAQVRFGGEDGATIDVKAGDAVLVPAGVGHKLLSSSPGLLVIGGYPEPTRVDLMREGEDDPDGIRRRIAAVSKPAKDPVTGAGGPMSASWRD